MKPGRHGGDIYRNEVAYDFSINLNPLGMPKQVEQALKNSVEGWGVYPDPECQELTHKLAVYHGIPSEWILCGNGAADLIYQLVWAIKPRRCLLAAPAFSEYGRALRGIGCRVDCYSLKETDGFALDMELFAGQVTKGIDLVFLCNPNNPNGLPVCREDVLCLADACRSARAMLVVDECFCELLEEPGSYSVVSGLEGRTEVAVLRAFTKTYAMAGLRLGYVACPDEALLERVRLLRQPWSVSVPAQQAGIAALRETEYLFRARALIAKERERVRQKLQDLGLRVYPSAANFLLFRNPAEAGQEEGERGGRREGVSRGNSLWERCRSFGILIRDCSDFCGLGRGYYRVCIRQPQENDLLLRVLEDALGRQ